MIKQLLLTHFVLVEKAEISFSPHFNIVTGETGAGKTAIIEAIGLALGSRADTSLIRQGCDRAIVEASFDISSLQAVHAFLDEAGIAYDPHEDLIIRREITHEGKNRAYVNCHLVPLPFLQKVGNELIDFIGQHAIQELRTSDFQRTLLDLYGNLTQTRLLFQNSFKKEKILSQRCEELLAKEAHREKNEELLRYQLKEIEDESLQEGEDEALFQQYQRLAHQREIIEKVKEILDKLAEAPSSVLSQLNRLQKLNDSLVKIDNSLSEPSTLIQQALISLQEAHFQYDSYFSTLEQDPHALHHLENRLSNIARLKKKYGKSVAEINALKQKLINDLLEFDSLSLLFQEAQKELALAQTETAKFAQQLTLQRKECALLFEQLLSSHLQSLNMSKAEIHIDISPQNRTQDGDDCVQFWLKANPGEQPALVREHSSGGELSRLFLAIKLALAEKNKTPTLIFDEIDANVGGKTASIIGEKLAELGVSRQIICITHFPQVAAKATSHFSVHKQEREGRTVTEISLLSKKQREQELLRMMGGETSFSRHLK
jgi:DNA repair protein RecN (Recombination protein N)